MSIQLTGGRQPIRPARRRAFYESWVWVGAALALGLIGAAFVRYTSPAPDRFQKALFFTLLALIFVELLQARRRWRPSVLGARVRRATEHEAGRAQQPLPWLGFFLVLGGFLAFLWGTVGRLLTSGSADFISISAGALSIILGVMFLLPSKDK